MSRGSGTLTTLNNDLKYLSSLNADFRRELTIVASGFAKSLSEMLL